MKRKRSQEDFSSLPHSLLLNSVALFLTAQDVGVLKSATKALRGKVHALWISRCTWTSNSIVRLREHEWRHVKHFIISKNINNLGGLTGLTHLTFTEHYDPPIDAVVWPTTLTNLKFGVFFNHPLPKLPEGLKNLALGWAFDRPVDPQVLPDDLENLKFGDGFNSSLPKLPEMLKRLTFGHLFNKPVDATVLPDGLQHLEFGVCFNQPVVYLPSQLKSLVLNHRFRAEMCAMPDGLL
jgi:hypothetical protein